MRPAPKVHVIHENAEWSAPLFVELERRGLPYADWFIHERTLDLSATPPEGVFYNRMSASSHTRGHRYSPELTAGILAWLEAHERTVWNGSRALVLELSKIQQAMLFHRHQVPTPKTIACVGKAQILEASLGMCGSFITKHNRAGKGLGVRLFHSRAALEQHLESEAFDPSVDGITLIQEYIQAPEPFIVRMEFIGQRFVYAVRVDTSEGFELCPADVCQIGDQVCPSTPDTGPRPKFELLEGFEHPLVPRVEMMLVDAGVHVAGVEFITDEKDRFYVYDLNTNTNYNSAAEQRAGGALTGMGTLAQRLGEALSAAGVDARAQRGR
jgi:hypothetical protein